jgi:hypothetical protein
MKTFVWGMAVGAVAMWFWLNGLQPIVDAVAGTWATVSSPPAESRSGR